MVKTIRIDAAAGKVGCVERKGWDGKEGRKRERQDHENLQKDGKFIRRGEENLFSLSSFIFYSFVCYLVLLLFFIFFTTELNYHIT